MKIYASLPTPFSLEFSCNFICFSNSVSASVTQQRCHSAWTQPSSVNAGRCPRQNFKMILFSWWIWLKVYQFYKKASFFLLIFLLFSLSHLSLVFMISINWVFFVLSLVALAVRLGLFPYVKLYGYKFPLRTAFPASHRFWIIVAFTFSDFFSDLLIF